jgi:membrane-associated phospholipid phosphatase
MGAVIISLLLADLLLPRFAQISGSESHLAALPYMLYFVAAYCYCAWAGMARLAEVLLISVSLYLFCLVLCPFVHIAARFSLPLVDRDLQHIDSFGIETATIMHLIARVPGALHFFVRAYYSLPELVLAALFVPIFAGKAHVSRRALASMILGALITQALFLIWPAVGPWTTEPITAQPDQAAITRYLALLQSGHPMKIDWTCGAIISFPSFHVVLAVLSALSLAKTFPRLRWFAFAIAAVICISTLTTGWHYVSDVLGGLIVSFAAISLADLITARPVQQLISTSTKTALYPVVVFNS